MAVHAWRELREFKDRDATTLAHLAENARAGKKVPPTMWAPASESHGPPWNFGPWPLVLRVADAAPLHDSHGAEMLVAHHPGEFRRLYDALAAGHPESAIYVQPAAEIADLIERG